ncbi:NmrA domain-containing protein [Fusarium keratoplasticum]|nr:NmrA domain-containing protein [Fusarium keratoplasticum]
MAEASGKKIIVVIGGTGMVGGSVANSLHDNPDWWVRLTTRDPTTRKAKRRVEKDFDVVQADSWNADELDAAFKDAYGVFLNTDSDDLNFKNEIGPPESAMGKLVIDAAIRQGVKYFVFSGLPEANRITNGEVSILSFDNKNAIANYGRAAGFEAFVEVNIGWAMDIFWMETYGKAFGGFATIPDREGFLTLKIFPMTNNPERIPWTSVRDDYGDAVHAVFLNPKKYDKKTIWAISDYTSFQDVADAYNRVTGTQVARSIPEHEPLKAATPGKTKEVNGLRNYCHFVKGNYCNNQPTDENLLKEVRELKKIVGKARRRGEGGQKLQTIEGFIRAYCPVKQANKL